MSKAVMLSIRPKWVEKIANGKKTIEVRKTKPRLDTPFKCYIYCTQPKYPHEDFISTDYPKPQFYGGGKVIGEFTCDRIYELAPLNHAPDDVEKQACLTREEIVNYLKGTGYGWHISDLLVYDEPRDLGEFWQDCLEYSELSTNCWSCENVCGDGDETDCNTDGRLYLHRPPQSWYYVEAMDGERKDGGDG